MSRWDSCVAAPPGWTCSRIRGHRGPCRLKPWAFIAWCEAALMCGTVGFLIAEILR